MLLIIFYDVLGGKRKKSPKLIFVDLQTMDFFMDNRNCLLPISGVEEDLVGQRTSFLYVNSNNPFCCVNILTLHVFFMFAWG